MPAGVFFLLQERPRLVPSSSSWLRSRLSDVPPCFGAPPLLHSLPSSTAAGRHVATVLKPMQLSLWRPCLLGPFCPRCRIRTERRSAQTGSHSLVPASPSRSVSFFKPGHFTSSHINPQRPCTSSPLTPAYQASSNPAARA